MKRLGLFQIGEIRFAVLLSQILKILQDTTGYWLPHLPRAVSAVLVDNDQLVPVLNLEQLLLGKGDQSGSPISGYQVLVGTELGTVALPADFVGQIVSEQKGQKLPIAAQEEAVGTVAKFIYQDEEYRILEINLLALEVNRGFWQNQPGTAGARRHQG